MVLAHSLKDKGAKGKLVVLATMDNLSKDAVMELKVIKILPSAAILEILTLLDNIR